MRYISTFSPNSVFDRPNRLSRLSRLIPHCRKVGVHPSSGYFSWVLVRRASLLSAAISLTCARSFLSLSLSSLNLRHPSNSQIELHVRSQTPGHRAPPLSFRFIRVYPSSARILLLLLSDSFISFARTNRLSRSLAVPYTRIEVVDIVLRSVSKLRENDGLVVLVVWLVSLVVFHPCSFIPGFLSI